MSDFLKALISTAKTVATNFVPGAEPIVNSVTALIKSAKSTLEPTEQDQKELDAAIDQLQDAVNQKADDTVDRLRGK